MSDLLHFPLFQGLESISDNEVQVLGGQDIKVEETADPLLVAPTCQSRQSASVQPQHHRDIRTVLVKEESTSVLNDAQVTQGSKQMRWNVETDGNEETDLSCKSPYDAS